MSCHSRNFSRVEEETKKGTIRPLADNPKLKIEKGGEEKCLKE